MEFLVSVLPFVAQGHTRLVDPPGCLQFSLKKKKEKRNSNPPTGLCERVGPTQFVLCLTHPLSPEGEGLFILHSWLHDVDIAFLPVVVYTWDRTTLCIVSHYDKNLQTHSDKTIFSKVKQHHWRFLDNGRLGCDGQVKYFLRILLYDSRVLKFISFFIWILIIYLNYLIMYI